MHIKCEFGSNEYQQDIYCSRRATRLTSNPVDGDAFDPADAGSYDVLPPGLITFSPGNSVQAHICPVDSVISCNIQFMTRQSGVMNVAAINIFVPSNNAAHETPFLLQHGPFRQMLCGTIKE